VDYTIRNYQLSDAHQLGDLFSAYLTFYKTAHDPVEAAAYINARVQQDESTIFVATDSDGQLVGFTQLYPTFASLALAPAWTLYDLFVSPSARKRGVAQALIRQAVQLGQETGAAVLTLETATDNRAAMALYEKLGWSRETDFHGYYLELE
jgi:ribosomal protein S18 acetylase RimI-like enzyme